MNITISEKLYGGFGVIILLMLCISIFTLFRIDQISTISDEIGSDDLPGVILYLHVLDEVGDMQSNVLEYMTGETDEIENFEENYKEFNNYYSQLKPLESVSQKDRDKMANIKSLVDGYVKRSRDEVFSRYNPDTEKWAFALIKKLEAGIGVELEALLDKLKEQKYSDALSSTDLQKSLNDDLPGVRLYLELIDEAGDMLASVASYTAGDLSKKAAFDKDAQSFATYLNQLKPLERKPNEVADLNKIFELYSLIKSESYLIFDKFDPTGRATALRSVDDMEHSIFDVVEGVLDASANEEKADATKAIRKNSELLDSMKILLIIATLIALIFGTVLSHILAKSINGRLSKVLAVASNINDGNLSVAPIEDASTDEIGILGQMMNNMLISLNALLQEIHVVANNVHHSSSEILSASQEAQISCNEQVLKTTTMAEAAEKMSQSVSEIAEQSAQASINAESSGSLAAEGGSIVDSSVTSINQVSIMVGDIAKTIENLGRRSDEIGAVIQVIDGIAEQTNLLALNAAIEAARAGDQGRGFAVVADEVRQLASRTSGATKEVANSIGAIQQETKEIIVSINRSSALVNETVDFTEKAGDSLKSIVQSADELNNMISSIAKVTEDQLASTNRIVQDVNLVNGSATDVLDINKLTSRRVENLNNQAQQLEVLIGRFKLRA
ncbi:MAG: hypothetical protein OFPII_22900 [Osedax symbiont Rs1]|nr:MAG: hypothetical protein OFPII_22900 [Osedax symbiont Rs1]